MIWRTIIVFNKWMVLVSHFSLDELLPLCKPGHKRKGYHLSSVDSNEFLMKIRSLHMKVESSVGVCICFYMVIAKLLWHPSLGDLRASSRGPCDWEYSPSGPRGQHRKPRLEGRAVVRYNTMRPTNELYRTMCDIICPASTRSFC